MDPINVDYYPRGGAEGHALTYAFSQRTDKITEPCLPPKYRGLQLSNQINDKSRRCLARDAQEAEPGRTQNGRVTEKATFNSGIEDIKTPPQND